MSRKGNSMDSKEVHLELKVKLKNKKNVEPNWMGIYIDDQEDQSKGKQGVVFIATKAFPQKVRFIISMIVLNKNIKFKKICFKIK